MSTAKDLPTDAKLVFKGKIFDTYQWEQKLFDGTTTTFERLKRPNTATVIPVIGDKILVTEQEQPDTHSFLSTPGGRCDGDEDMLVAAKRELLEETGYVSDDWELFRAVQPFNKIVWTISTYIARNCRKQQDPHVDAGEKIEIQFFDFEDFLLLSENTQFRDVELTTELLRMRVHPDKKEAFRKQLFK